MGWLWTTTPSSTAPTPPTPKISTDGTPIAPDRRQRAKCWEGRDAFFACLTLHSIIDSTTPPGSIKAKEECGKELERFEGNCASSWVEYFKKRRVMEWQRDQTMKRLEKEGAQKIPGEMKRPDGPVGGA